jgi:two-component system, OmpR family, sensor histidine kinase KdpD
VGETQDGSHATSEIGDLSGRAPSDDLLEQLRLRDTFLLALAHDLRASVASIAGASEALRARASDGDGNDALLDLVDEATTTIQVVISNLFDVERLRNGTIEVVRQPTDLEELLRRAVEDAGLSGLVTIDAEPTVAELDPGLTERVLWNVLRNAAVHAPPGTPVTLCASDEGDHVLIRVEDSGPGIPPGEREIVFEPFQRGSTGGPGTGVGLFLVRQFSRVQGGEAWIEGRPHGGTAIHVRLPC